MVFLITTLILVSCQSLLTSACGAGWMKNGSYCFLFGHTELHWIEAVDTCKLFGAILAEPATPEIDAFLGMEAIALGGGRRYWLGGADLAMEGHWKWVSNFDDFRYTNWRPSEPNTLKGEECLLMNWQNDGTWDDADCEDKFYYICQKEDELGGISVIG